LVCEQIKTQKHTSSKEGKRLLVYRLESESMASNMWALQPMLTQTGRAVTHSQSYISEQRFNSPRMQRARCETPPPAPRRCKPPPLLRALERNDLVKVRSCLQADADVASLPFWDHDVEPPLCAAMRLRCDARIIKTLLDGNANPEAVDSHGRSPSQILASLSSSTPEPDVFINPFPVVFPLPVAATQDLLPYIPGGVCGRVA